MNAETFKYLYRKAYSLRREVEGLWDIQETWIDCRDSAEREEWSEFYHLAWKQASDDADRAWEQYYAMPQEIKDAVEETMSNTYARDRLGNWRYSPDMPF